MGSSTSSAKVPVKKSSLVEKQTEQGGGQPGHAGVERKTFSSAEADEGRIGEFKAEICQTYSCALHQ